MKKKITIHIYIHINSYMFLCILYKYYLIIYQNVFNDYQSCFFFFFFFFFFFYYNFFQYIIIIFYLYINYLINNLMINKAI